MTKRNTAASGRRRSFVRIETDTALQLIEAVTNAGCAIQAHGAAIIAKTSENGRWVGEEDAAIDAAVVQSALAGLDRVEDVLNAAISSNDDGLKDLAILHVEAISVPKVLDEILANVRPVSTARDRFVSKDGREVRVSGDQSLIDEVGAAWAASKNKPVETLSPFEVIAFEEAFRLAWVHVFDRMYEAGPSVREAVLASIKNSDIDLSGLPHGDALNDGVSEGIAAAKEWISTRGRKRFLLDGPHDDGKTVVDDLDVVEIFLQSAIERCNSRVEGSFLKQILRQVSALRDELKRGQEAA